MCITFSPYSSACAKRDEWHRGFPLCPNAKETGALFVDANSMGRNSTAAASAFGTLPAAASTFIATSAAVSGIVGTAVGLSLARDGYKRARAAAKVSDWEGTAHQATWGLVGTGYAGLSAALATGGMMTLLGQTPPPTVGTVLGSFGIAFYGALFAHGSYGFWQTSKFRSALKQAVAERRAVEWLKEQITLNKEEQNLPAEEQEKLLQKKWSQFELRTNVGCAKLVRDKLPELQNDDEAQGLLLEVERANYKTRIKHILFIILAILGIIASLAVLYLTGPLSPLLFAISAVIWIGIDSSGVQDYVGEKFWSWVKPLSLPADSPSQKKKEHSAA